LLDVVITSPQEFQGLAYDGTNWVNSYMPVVSFVRNAEATTLTTGTVVYLFGSTGDHASVKRADNDSDTTSSKTVGLVAANILANENGPVVTRGYVDGIDLSVGYTAGDILWLGEDGGFTKVKPSAPEHLVFIGVVVRATANGIVYVATQNGYELDELHDVAINDLTLANGDVIRYNSTTGLWENSQAVGPAGPAGPAGPTSLVVQTTAPAATDVLWVDTDEPSVATVLPSMGYVSGLYYGAAVASNSLDLGMTEDMTHYAPFYLSETTTFDRIAIRTGTVTTTGTVRLGVYNNFNGKPSTVLFDAGTVSCPTASTFYTITINQTLPAGWYWFASNIQAGASGCTLTISDRYTTFGMAQYSANTQVPQTIFNQSGVTGAFATAGTLNVFSRAPIVVMRKA
jgi:hypothetical protein